VPTDFLGINYYSRNVLRDEQAPDNLPPTVRQAPLEEWTEIPWEVYPDGLYDILCRLERDYHPGRLYITENGASYSDGPSFDGRVHDERRIAYLRGHLAAAERAILAGVPLAGYFYWSLLDNLEWGRGYTQRFGLVWVDYETQDRIPKDSALWYRDLIARKGALE
jgi:beta-glucosidase